MMKSPMSAIVAVAIVAAVVLVAKSGPQRSSSDDQAAAAPVSAIKTVTSESCATDGCPVSCEAGDNFLSAFCVSGTRAHFAETLRSDGGTMTATCGMGTTSVLLYCGRQ